MATSKSQPPKELKRLTVEALAAVGVNLRVVLKESDCNADLRTPTPVANYLRSSTRRP